MEDSFAVHILPGFDIVHSIDYEIQAIPKLVVEFILGRWL
jgi:hypothetical protein